MGLYQMPPLRARVDAGVMASKGYSAFPKAQHYWNITIILFNIISRTLVGGSYPLLRCSRCTLHTQLIGQRYHLGEKIKNRAPST